MSKILHCRDVGFDCEGVVRGETEDEVLQQAAAHAAADHGLTEITPEIEAQIRAQIKDE
jgi:predicted small metal-binding protein